MLTLVCALFLTAPEPGAYPGPDSGYVPLPGQGQKKPEVYDPKQPSSEPESYVREGTPGKERDSSAPHTWAEMGQQRLKRKDPFAALWAFEQALRENPSDVGAKAGRAAAQYGIALYYQRRIRTDEAKKAYGKAIEDDPALADDEDFIWHYDMLFGTPPKESRRVNDPRPDILQRRWIGAHIRVGPHDLPGVGLSLVPIKFLRVEVSADPVFVGMSAHVYAYVPSWSFSPYFAVGGRLSFLNPPFGKTNPREGFEIWNVSWGSIGAGIQYSNPIGFYFSLGIHMLIIGGQKVGSVNADIGQPLFIGTTVYPYPLPELTVGWLFGG